MTRPILDLKLRFNYQTGTTYTLQATDNNKVVVLTNAAAIALTVPALGEGFNCMIMQGGAGQVTLTGSGVTLQHRQNHTKLAGQYATGSLVFTSTDCNFAGDTAA